MIQLSKDLKDPLVSDSQKWAEIEKSKFLLYNYCSETTNNYINKYKNTIFVKDAKEIFLILQKIREAMSRCFLKLGQLFYSKDEKEMYIKCEQKMNENQIVIEEMAIKYEQLKQEAQ